MNTRYVEELLAEVKEKCGHQIEMNLRAIIKDLHDNAAPGNNQRCKEYIKELKQEIVDSHEYDEDEWATNGCWFVKYEKDVAH